MRCLVCGERFQPTNHNGKTQKYCSKSCKNRAAYLRRKGMPVGERASADPSPVDAGGRGHELGRREFERMMDDSLEDVLRMNRDRLQDALQDPSTPANALPGISRQLIDVCERLQGMSGQGGLFDDESMEVVEDVGASIV